MVLSHDKALDPATASFILQHSHIEAIGDQAVTAVGTLDTAGETVTPLAGDDRYATARAVADQVIAAAGHPVAAVGIASGLAFPDALTGGASRPAPGLRCC